jgi:hypothetical protein
MGWSPSRAAFGTVQSISAIDNPWAAACGGLFDAVTDADGTALTGTDTARTQVDQPLRSSVIEKMVSAEGIESA